MSFYFHPEAEAELQDAINYYADIRRSLVSRFPYGVLYSEVDNKIHILAVMNLHRQPDCWKQRC